MIFTKEEAIRYHDLLVEHYGGTYGIRDHHGLESALARPAASFSGMELYPTPQAKAAALTQSLIQNHPFIDGNKRIAINLSEAYLIKEGFKITASTEEKYQFVIKIAEGKMSIEEIQRFYEIYTAKWD
jgi:death on curing protein